MGFNDSLTSLNERAAEIRADLVSPWSDNIDVFMDRLFDEGADLSAIVLLLLKGEGPEAVAMMDRLATQFCYREAGK